jgi:hypothetical protein
MTSAVLIVPTSSKEAANAFGESMGWGPNNYSVPLTTDGTTISHYGCRADVGQGFLDLMLNPPPEAESVLSVLISDFRETDRYTHFHEVISGLGLSLYVEGE